eukprot:COSAG05_NODE_4832_length_1356_cov_0.990453_1_plen_184_part_00
MSLTASWQFNAVQLAMRCFLLQHVGFADYAALPINRGWDKSFNYYAGSMNYYTKTSGGGNGFLDIHAMGGPDRDERYVDPDFYSGYLWQERAEQIITEHAEQGTDQPLFLYYAFQNPHASHLMVPEEYELLEPCNSMRGSMALNTRRIYCGMVRVINDCVEKTHEMMRQMIDPNFLMVFFADK